MEDFKERIKYIKVNSGRVIGKLTNYPIACQADNLEMLQERLSVMLQSYINFAQKEIDNKNFEVQEVEYEDWLKL